MSSRPYGCEAQEVGGQWRCERCNFTWDLNDKRPPDCLTDREIMRVNGRARLDQIREELRCGTSSNEQR